VVKDKITIVMGWGPEVFGRGVGSRRVMTIHMRKRGECQQYPTTLPCFTVQAALSDYGEECGSK
jgi:hypothetical protein